MKYSLKNLLLENQEHFDKLIVLLSSERIAEINMALELAQTLGYIGEYKYEKIRFLTQPPNHLWYVYGPKLPNGIPGTCDPDFLKAIGFPNNDLTPNTQIRTHRTPGGFMLALSER